MERRASTARETAYLPFLFVPHAQQPLVDAVFISPNESTSFVLVGAVTKTKPARLFFFHRSRDGRLKVDPSVPKAVKCIPELQPWLYSC